MFKLQEIIPLTKCLKAPENQGFPGLSYIRFICYGSIGRISVKAAVDPVNMRCFPISSETGDFSANDFHSVHAVCACRNRDPYDMGCFCQTITAIGYFPRARFTYLCGPGLSPVYYNGKYRFAGFPKQ